MIKYPNLIPECNVDTVFVEMLGYKSPNHAPDIHQVGKILEKHASRGKIMGFVDQDKKMTGYLGEFTQLEKINEVRLLKHPQQEHYLVMVYPAMDYFIFNLCKKTGLDISQYGLPNDFRAFKSFTKKQSIKNNPGFKNLLNALIQKRPAEIKGIKSWINKYTPYSVK